MCDRALICLQPFNRVTGSDSVIATSQRLSTDKKPSEICVGLTGCYMFSFTQKASQSGTRRDCFRKDTRLTDSQASLCKHYKYSGVDRGHMAPNGDFDSSNENDEAWMDTYLLSNIAPQYHGFNAGKGKKKNKTFIPKDDDTHYTINYNGTKQCITHLGSLTPGSAISRTSQE